MVAAEREIGVREVQAGDDLRDLRFLTGVGFASGSAGLALSGISGPVGRPAGILRIEEARGLRALVTSSRLRIATPAL